MPTGRRGSMLISGGFLGTRPVAPPGRGATGPPCRRGRRTQVVMRFGPPRREPLRVRRALAPHARESGALAGGGALAGRSTSGREPGGVGLEEDPRDELPARAHADLPEDRLQVVLH